jgi:DNA polymerase-1
VHTSYHQAGTVTGRLSSSSPNLQNIPIKDEYGRKIRECFIAAPGNVLISADYSQIELRLMAHFSGDLTLINAYKSNQDIHLKTASHLYQCSEKEITYEQRQFAKIVNFGLIYGMSSWGLAKKLHISIEQAHYFINKYFQQYPSILTYTESVKKFATDHGYVETLIGRRIPIDFRQKKSGLRSAINAPLQGTASDLIKLAMILINKHIMDSDEIYLLLQVHDELLFEVKEDKVQKWIPIIKNLMENCLPLAVPIVVNCNFGYNWRSAH